MTEVEMAKKAGIWEPKRELEALDWVRHVSTLTLRGEGQ